MKILDKISVLGSRLAQAHIELGEVNAQMADTFKEHHTPTDWDWQAIVEGREGEIKPLADHIKEGIERAIDGAKKHGLSLDGEPR